jgi:hypothetical protein
VNMITESVSKKRGRPLLICPFELALIGNLEPEGRTKRGLQNIFYAHEAASVLDKENPRYRWFRCEPYRQGILCELGRARADLGREAAVDLADRMCELFAGPPPRAREAAAWVRAQRLEALDRPQKPSPEALARRLSTVIQNYFEAAPGTNAQVIERALALVARNCRRDFA